MNFKPNGDDLAKVLHFFGYAEDENKIVCPFHDDVNPSMIINYEDGTFYCFGCNTHGNAYDFVSKLLNTDDDLEVLFEYFHVLRSNDVRQLKRQPHNKVYESSAQALVEAEDYYYGLKAIDWSKEDSKERDYMHNRGFRDKILTECGARYTYNISYPIIFPMLDNGTFKGWVCRTTNKAIEKKRKYLYNTGFSRSSTLCGDYKSKTVVICEGYMDMLKFKQFGIKNVVAILGWKITGMQVDKLKKSGVKYVVSALDTDECGRKGSEYLKSFFEVVRFQYPEGIKDAGEMTQPQFDKAFEKTKNIFRRK